MEKAVASNSAAGRNNLGYMYLHGYGVPKDVERALALFTKAAAQGLTDAQHNLGDLYFFGQGTARDYRKAMHYFSLATQVRIADVAATVCRMCDGDGGRGESLIREKPLSSDVSSSSQRGNGLRLLSLVERRRLGLWVRVAKLGLEG